jgi:predicted transcriptional regulator
MKNKRPTFEKFKKRALQNEELKAAYELLGPEFELLEKFIRARKKAHCSQLELAKRLNIQQPTIARLEKGGYTTTSVSKLVRIADALGYSVKISLLHKKT